LKYSSYNAAYLGTLIKGAQQDPLVKCKKCAGMLFDFINLGFERVEEIVKKSYSIRLKTDNPIIESLNGWMCHFIPFTGIPN